MLRILGKKGYALHEKQGWAFVYTPVLAREQARQSAIRWLVSQLLNDSQDLLVLNNSSNITTSVQENSPGCAKNWTTTYKRHSLSVACDSVSARRMLMS